MSLQNVNLVIFKSNTLQIPLDTRIAEETPVDLPVKRLFAPEHNVEDILIYLRSLGLLFAPFVIKEIYPLFCEIIMHHSLTLDFLRLVNLEFVTDLTCIPITKPASISNQALHNSRLSMAFVASETLSIHNKFFEVVFPRAITAFVDELFRLNCWFKEIDELVVAEVF